MKTHFLSLINFNARKTLKLTIFVVSFFIFSFLFFLTPVQAAGTEVYGTMTSDQVWDKAHSPYVISWRDNGLIVRAKLTILPGTVIKFYASHDWNNYYGLKIDGANGGQLIANGTTEEPIIFTSWYDDETMGDTNNDVAWYQAPLPGDYRAITFYQTNNSSLANVLIKYGGTSRNNDATILLDNSAVSFNNLKLLKNLQPGMVLKNNSQALIDNLEAWENKNEALQLNDTSQATLNNNAIHNNLGSCVLKISAASNLSGTNNSFVDNSTQKIIITPYDISQTVTWKKWNLTYYLEGQIKILPTGQLTVEAGVEARWGYYYSRLLNLGELIVNGTAAAPVIFTSFSDNALANNDSWGGVAFDPGSRGQINYLTIKDAGTYSADWTGSTYLTNEYNALRLSSANPEFNHLIIDHSKTYGLNITGASAPLINNCEIKNSLQWGVISNSSSMVTLKNCSFVNNIAGALRNDSLTVIDARESWWGSATGPKTNLHPNGQGAKAEGLIVYEPWQGKENLSLADLEPVIVIPGITGSWQKYIVAGEWRLDPFFHTYDDLLAALRQAGYVDNVSLFPFPYQWRQDNNLTAVDLKNKIQAVKNITGKNKVDLVVHSMGGIVARTYIQSTAYANDVDQLIFLGTPQTGSISAYVPWMSGLNLVKGKNDIYPQILNLFFQMEADYYNYNDLFNYVQDKVKSVEQLLPIFDYLIDNDTNVLRTYSDNYPPNIFLENLNQPANVLKLKQRVQMTNIVSDNGLANTAEFLKVVPYLGSDGKWTYGYPAGYTEAAGDHGLIMGAGDETVPLKSASDLAKYPIVLINTEKHRDMPTLNQNDVIHALTGKNPTTLVEQKNFNGLTVLNAFLLLTLHSPVDLEIIDPAGHKIGKDFASNLEINEIPGAFYSGFDGPTEFVFIPNPLAGEYKINLQGTASGEYGVEINYADDSQEKNTSFTSMVSAGEIINLASDLEPENLNNWQINPADINPPVITLMPNKEKYFSNEIINLTITDTESGLSAVNLLFDNVSVPVVFATGATSTIVSLDLKNYNFGIHTLYVIANDNANQQVEFNKTLEIYTDINQTLIIAENIWYKYLWAKKIVLTALQSIKNDYANLSIGTNYDKIKIAIKLKIAALKLVLKTYQTQAIIKTFDYQILINNLNYLLSKL